MRRPAPDSRPVGLTIAGSDSGGGAGIQADLATMTAHGVFGTSAITAVTAQNTLGVDSAHVLSLEEIEAQLEAVLSDFEVGAAKTGMLATASVIELVAEYAADAEFPIVVDPVMVATSGDRLLDVSAERAYEDLLAEATLVTPNADEAAVLVDVEVEDEASARDAGAALLEFGVDAALVKGGHVPGETVRDVLVTGSDVTVFEHPRIDTDATHGSGCTLAAAITARLAGGEELESAVGHATEFLARAVRYHADVGGGPGAVNHAVALRNRAAREPTAEAVQGVADRLVTADVSSLVPDAGTPVVGATPYAESPDEVAAVDGRLVRTRSGVDQPRGVRFSASSDLAGFLLSAREVNPALRFAATVRFDEDVDAALESLEWPAVRGAVLASVDGRPAATRTTSETDDEVQELPELSSERPVVVVDRGGVGRAPSTTLLTIDAAGLADRVLELGASIQ